MRLKKESGLSDRDFYTAANKRKREIKTEMKK